MTLKDFTEQLRSKFWENIQANSTSADTVSFGKAIQSFDAARGYMYNEALPADIELDPGK